MAKISRRQLKRDEVRDTVTRGWSFVSTHRRGSLEAVVALAVAAALVGGIFGVRSYRERRASEALSKGLATLDTPLVGDSNAAGAAGKSYTSEAERQADALRYFQKAAGYSGTEAGKMARLVLAAEQARTGSTQNKALGQIPSSHDLILSGIGEIDRARLLASEGRVDDAIGALKRAIDSPDTKAPKDALLNELGRIAENAGRSDEARRAWQRLVDEYPRSPYLPDARQRMTAL
jgi:tetratricopeptide (TPR) repeat protein